MSRAFDGLQCVALCFLPHFLTDEAKAEIFPRRLGNLLERRWVPALNYICGIAGFTEAETDSFLLTALEYFQGGLTASFTIDN
ncbi:MAG TPA: hypothetical protein VJ828_06670 [Lacipirellulaceae bacterium]|nr:hypothetical protein [Lacipirellulaceae bacterium]